MTEEALPSASMGLTRRVRLGRTVRRGRKGRLGLKTRRGRKGRCGRRCRAWRAASCGTSGAARRNRALLNVVLHRWLRPVHVEVRKLYAERLADLLSIDRPLSHFLILSSSTYLDRISPLQIKELGFCSFAVQLAPCTQGTTPRRGSGGHRSAGTLKRNRVRMYRAVPLDTASPHSLSRNLSVANHHSPPAQWHQNASCRMQMQFRTSGCLYHLPTCAHCVLLLESRCTMSRVVDYSDHATDRSIPISQPLHCTDQNHTRSRQLHAHTHK